MTLSSASVHTDPETGQTVDASAMDSIIGYRLRRAQLTVFQQFNERFAAYDLTPSEYSVLVLIHDNPGCRQGAIANVLGIKRANFATLIKSLDDRGLTERRSIPGDKRSNALHLTPTGEKFLAEAKKTQDDFERHCIDLLGGTAERDTLMKLLDRLTGHTG